MRLSDVVAITTPLRDVARLQVRFAATLFAFEDAMRNDGSIVRRVRWLRNGTFVG